MKTPYRVFGIAYNDEGVITDLSIYVGRKQIGSITLKGRFYIAKIGPSEGKGFAPDVAAEQAWREFCAWEETTGYAIDKAFGLNREEPVDPTISFDAERITVRTTKRDRGGNSTEMDIYAGVAKAGKAVKQRDSRWLVRVGRHVRTGVEPLPAARLAWIENKGLVR